MAEPETSSEVIELSMQDPTEVNEGASDAGGDDAGTGPGQASPRDDPADGWRQRFMPDMSRAAQPRTLRDWGGEEEDEEENDAERDIAAAYTTSETGGSDTETYSDTDSDSSSNKRKPRAARKPRTNAWSGLSAPTSRLPPPTRHWAASSSLLAAPAKPSPSLWPL